MLERLPYFKMHAADYLLDTRNLSLEEHGIYCLLMFTYYWNGRLPTDRAELETLVNVYTDAQRSSMQKVLDRYFLERDGEIVHNRIERELVNLRGFFNAQKKNADRSVQARKDKKLTGDESSPAPDKPKRTNGHALDLSALPDEWRVWTATERPDLNPEQVFATFSDHWLANKNHANAKKANWFATWRNWVRKEKAPSIFNGKSMTHTGNFGRCKYCEKPATRRTNDIAHCDTPRHIDFAIGRN